MKPSTYLHLFYAAFLWWIVAAIIPRFVKPAIATGWFYPPIDTACPQWQLEKSVMDIVELSRNIQIESDTSTPLIESTRRISLRDTFFTPEPIIPLSYCQERAIPVLKELLSTSNERVQSIGVWLASNIGKSSVPILLELFSKINDSRQLQIDIVEALGIIGNVREEVKAYVPLFLELLYTENILYERLNIVQAIGNIGIADKDIVSAISDLMEETKAECIDADFSCTRSIVVFSLALGKIGESEIALKILEEELSEPDGTVYLSVEQAFDIIEISKDSPEGVSTIVALLEDSPDETVRANIALAVGQLKSEKSVLVPALLKALKTETNPNVLLNAALSLLSLGETHQEISSAIASVIINLDDYVPYVDSQVEEIILFSVRTLGSRMREQVPVLLQALEKNVWQEDDPFENNLNEKFIINILGEIGIYAEIAKPTLVELLEHDDNEIRQAAIEALGAIETNVVNIISLLGGGRRSGIFPLSPNLSIGGLRGRELLNEPTILNEVFFIYDTIIRLEAIGRVGAGCRVMGDLTPWVVPPWRGPTTDLSIDLSTERIPKTQKRGSIECEYPELVWSLVSIGLLEDRYVDEYEYEYEAPVITRLDLSSKEQNEDNIAPRILRGRPEINPWDVRTLFRYHQCSGGSCKTEKSEIFRRLGKAFSRLDPSAAPVLARMLTSDIYLQEIGYLEPEFPIVRRVAAYGLSEMNDLPDEIIRILEGIVRDQKIDLDTRRFAAYSLETTNTDVQWLFDQYQLVPYQNFDCRPHHQAAHADFFDKYGGQCESHIFILNGGGSLFAEIKQLLFPDSDG